VSLSVLLVDDNVLFRDGLADILRADGRFDVVGQASRGDEAVAAATKLRPDLILMDLRMPGMSGVEAIRRIRAENPAVSVGVLTVFETAEWAQSALAAGATGYLAKDSTPADLCDAAAAIGEGKPMPAALPQPVRREIGAGSPTDLLARLTTREVEVLRALATDATNEAIARSLGISPRTLRNHISSTYRKLRVYDRAQAVIVAIREGLVEVPSR
jgi:DNA-binding NarL/FixJ family response regulator